METVERDYSPRGVRFFYIYKALAHPEQNGYVTPFTLQERLLHVAEAKRKLGSRITWLCDSMTNDLKHALGNAPNSEFLVDPEGKILVARNWSRPDELREDLAKLLGAVDSPTSITDVGMQPLQPPKTAPTGIVARVQVTGNRMPVRVEPVANSTSGEAGEPFYVKLRAEIDAEYFRNGDGKLYLGFFLDPLYKVHWNNQAAAIRYEIDAPDALSITPDRGQGPDVSAPADADPREFLVEVAGRSAIPITLTVRYFACDDAETFCKPVTQQYHITLQRDPDGGSRRTPGARGRRPPRFANQADAASERRGKILRAAVALIRQHDQDEDGRLDRDEWSAIDQPFDRADANSDGRVSLQELIDGLQWIE